MTRWEAFITICSYLRAGLLGGHRELKQNLNWELIIEVASFHYVTPVLAWCLRKDECVPTDVRDYFEASLALNMERNQPMLSGLARLAGLLNAIDIEPILLKGAACMVEGTYPEPSLQILGDVDVLIPAKRSAECVAALQAAGFSTKSSDVILPPDTSSSAHAARSRNWYGRRIAYGRYQSLCRFCDLDSLVLRGHSANPVPRSPCSAAGAHPELLGTRSFTVRFFTA